MEIQGRGGFVVQKIFAVSFFLFAGVLNAQTISSAIGFPSLTCTGTAPLANPGPLPGMPGTWNDAARYGTGWELDYYPIGTQTELGVSWFTYDQGHHPVWLQAGPAVYNSTSGQWAATLNKVTWSANANGTGKPGTVSTAVGSVAIQFTPNSANSAAIRWQWNEYGASPAPDECINNVVSSYQQSAAAPALATLGGIDQSYSAPWYDPSHSGWGLGEVVGSTNLGNVELQTMTIYDVAGQPVWLQAATGPQSAPISSANTTASLWYYESSYAMNTACSGNPCRVAGAQAGNVTRSFPSNTSETFTVNASVSNAIATNTVTWPNPAMSFPNNRANPVTYSPEVTTSYLTKLGVTNYLFVSQTYCLLTGTQTTCPIQVSWTNTDTTALVYEFSKTGQLLTPLTNNDGSGCVASSSFAISTAYTGSVNVCVPASGDVIFKLISGNSPTGTVQLSSAEVIVSALPAAQNAAITTVTGLPATVQAGQAYNVSFTALNNGSSTWTQAGQYELAAINPAGTTNWTTTQVSLPANVSVAPGQSYTFNFSVTAPYAAGTANFQWQMLQSNVGYFGQPSTNQLVTVSAVALSSICGTETIGGNTFTGGLIFTSNPVLTAGQTYPATVTMQNTGTATWTAAALFGLGSSDPRDNGTWGIGRIEVPTSVAPNAMTTLSFNIVAPTTPGLYYYQWQMVQDGVQWFGQVCPNQYIKVAPASIPLPPPAVTTSPAVNPQTTAYFTLNWGPGSTTSAPAPTYYVLQYAPSATGPWITINSDILPTGSNNAYGVTLITNNNYYFQVAACDAQGCSAYTESAAVTVTLPPVRPENVSVSQPNSTSNTFTLNWTQPTSATPATSYSIQQATSPTGPWTPASSSGTGCTGANCSSTITVAGAGTYYYEVAACTASTNCSVYARGTNAAAGGTASASSTYPGYSPAAIIDGDRAAFNWSAGDGWNDNTANVFPDTAAVTWSAAKTIQSVVVYTLQDYWLADADPSDTMAFSAYGLTAFDVQVFTNGAWSTVGTVTGNTLVKNTVTFSPVSATGVQIITHNAAGGQYSRLVELEALSLASATVTSTSLSAAFSSQTVSPTMVAGQKYNVLVTMQNTGSTTWSSGQSLALTSVAADGTLWGLAGGVSLPTGTSVAPNATYTFNFNIVAPPAAGSYDFQWRLAQNGVPFGASSTVQTIAVSAPPILAPISVTVPATSSSNQVTVTWIPAPTGAAPAYFLVQQTSTPTTPTSWAAVGGHVIAPASSLSVTVAANGTYYFQVAACTAANVCSGYTQGANVAAAANGAAASAYSVYGPTYLPSTVIDGDRTGSSWPNGGGWNDNTPNVFTTDWVEIDFAAPKAINTIKVYMLQDVLGQGVEPSDALTFTQYGVTQYELQMPNGSGGWTDIVPIINNTGDLVKQTTVFPTVTTSSIRVLCDAAVPGHAYSHLVEVEAFVPASVVVQTVAAVTPPTAPPTTTAVLDAPVHDATVGAMAGQAGTDGGAAQYTIPIVVPPGRAGMQPSLSLNYNSRSGNGVMGMGWTISGLSSVHRCPQTPEQDGQTLGVSYTNSDRLCLDGQRLVAISGNYGAANTVYRTEVDNYARVTQLGGDLSSTDTACFRVEQKDGHILHYGGVTTASACTVSAVNSRVKPSGAAASLSWLVEKIEDRVGNNETLSYTNAGNGEVLIATIAYTGFTPTAAAGDRTVVFTYQTRAQAATGANDISSSYLAGGLTMQTQALAAINTKVSGVVVRTYKPVYTVSQYSQRLMMMSVQECAGTANPQTCHAPTTFTYNDGVLNYVPAALNAAAISLQGGADPSAYQDPNQIVSVPDVDGDGARETIVATGTGTNEQIYLVQLGADQSVRNVVNVTGTYMAGGFPGAVFLQPSSYADFDGDGRAEVVQTPLSSTASQVLSLAVWNQGRGVTLAANAPNPFTTIPTNIPYSFTSTGQGPVYVADVNGDGRPDVVLVKPDSTCGSDARGANSGVFVYLNNLPTGQLGTGYGQLNTANFTAPTGHLFCLQSTVTSSGAGYIGLAESIDHIADFNGDGLPDFYLNNLDLGTSKTALSRIVLTTQSGTTLGTTSAPCSGTGGIGLVSDVNSDGTVATDDECNGNKLTAYYYTAWIDVNGDGLEDLVIAKANAGNTWQVHLNQGNGTLGGLINTGQSNGLATSSKGNYRYVGRLPTMDVDGDGKPDLLIPSTTAGIRGFAQKMCSVNVVAPTNNGTCPAATIGAAPALVAVKPQLSTQQCITYMCPEDPAAVSGTLWMPTNSDGTSGNGVWPYAWNSENGDTLAVRALYGPFGAGSDNSVYHLAQLKFLQTGPSTITVQVNETPIISRLLGSNSIGQTHADDLYGNGLPGVLTTVGCFGQVTKLYTNGNPSQNYNSCRVVNE
jgi:hypothetical protein